MDANRGKIFRASLFVPFASRKQSFEWNASLMETGTTWQALVDQSYMSSKLRGTDRGNVATWACSEHEYVNRSGNISDYHAISSF
jgi:hypothetical protein